MAFHDSHHAALASGPEELFTGWRVISFVDPAGTGGDLAFTEGLSDIGLPELLLWARPTEGLDPGADWLLTPRERARLVNGWALDLASDRLNPVRSARNGSTVGMRWPVFVSAGPLSSRPSSIPSCRPGPE